ncbi:MAG: TetR/AcrR family transcriptional regulator [Sandaracinaceae bacterium]
MGRIANQQASETRARVLAAALSLFSEHGRSGVSIRAIGREAGVTLGTVHHHFGSKEDLYTACMEVMYEGIRQLRDSLLIKVATKPNIEDAIEEIIRASFAFGLEHDKTARLALRTVLDQGHLDDAYREGTQRPMIAEVGQLLAGPTGHDPATVQLVTQNLIYLVARSAIASDAERMLATGLDDPEVARAKVAEELVRTAKLLLIRR